MRHFLISGAVLPLVLCCAPAWAQETPAPLAGAAPPAATDTVPATADSAAVATPAACCLAARNTVLQLEIVRPVSTKTVRRGDTFEIRLTQPLVIDGRTLLPAGLMGLGEVTHAAGPSIGGKPGELMLAARYLDFNGQRIALKGLKMGVAGQDNAGAALAISMVTPLGILIPGGHVEVAGGSRANAKLAADLTLSPIEEAPPAASPIAPAPTAAPIAPVAAVESSTKQEQQP